MTACFVNVLQLPQKQRIPFILACGDWYGGKYFETLCYVRIANAVVGTVLRSHISHFLYHKVISASRLKEEGKESSCNMENWPKDIIHVSFDASSIK